MLQRVKALESELKTQHQERLKLSQQMAKQADIFGDMVIMFSVLLDKEVITNEEVLAAKEELQAKLDEAKSSAEGCDVQPKNSGADESGSGAGE